MFAMPSRDYFVLLVSALILGSSIGTLEAACDIQDVCKNVAKIKKEIFVDLAPPVDSEAIHGATGSTPPTLNEEIREKIEEKCKDKGIEPFSCPYDEVVTLCWEKSEDIQAVIQKCE